jgi:NADH pyrophosphatase NudC (nudix superfamily)
LSIIFVDKLISKNINLTLKNKKMKLVKKFCVFVNIHNTESQLKNGEMRMIIIKKASSIEEAKKNVEYLDSIQQKTPIVTGDQKIDEKNKRAWENKNPYYNLRVVNHFGNKEGANMLLDFHSKVTFSHIAEVWTKE